jgi:isopenicillin-N N-acyltransferase like protein
MYRVGLGLLLLSSVTCAGDAPPDAPQPSARINVIELFGDSPELGIQHGQQLGAQVRLLNDSYLKPMTGDNYEQAAQASLAFVPFISQPHLAEMKKLAEVSKMELKDVMFAQSFLDLDSMMACSTVTLPAAASPDGVARFARNLDFPSRGVADKASVILAFHPEGRNAFVAVTWPGLIGVLSGMNEHGLTLASMEITRERRPPTAMPYMLLYRTVLEQCKNVDEAIALLDKTPKQTSNNLMLMDASGARAVVEIDPDKITVRRTDDSHALISTNHHRGVDLATRGKCGRYDKLMDASSAQWGKVGVDELHKMLESVQQGDMTIQTMIFEPSTRKLYLATGAQSASQQFTTFDLRKLFSEERKRQLTLDQTAR